MIIINIIKIKRHWWFPFMTKYILVKVMKDSAKDSYTQKLACGDIIKIEDNTFEII